MAYWGLGSARYTCDIRDVVGCRFGDVEVGRRVSDMGGCGEMKRFYGFVWRDGYAKNHATIGSLKSISGIELDTISDLWRDFVSLAVIDIHTGQKFTNVSGHEPVD